MEITNENGDRFGKICGWRDGTDIIVVTGDYALLTFHSDYETQDKGFNISFIAIPQPGEYIPGLKITAGQRTMSGQNDDLSGQNFGSAVILTGHVHGFQINNTKKIICIIS